MDQRASDAAQHAAEMAAKANYSTALATVVMGMTLSDIAILFGIVATAITTFASVYYRRKEYRLKLARAKHEGIDTEVLDDDE